MRDIANLGLRLLLICLVAAICLGAVNNITKDPIREQEKKTNDEANQLVCPNAETFDELAYEDSWLADYGITTVYEGKQGGETVSYCLKIEGKGYGGTIEMSVGIDLTGKYLGVAVGNNGETPGLGANAAKEEFRAQYISRSHENAIGVSKTGSSDTEIQALSGATITSRAVTDVVNKAGQFYKNVLAAR